MKEVKITQNNRQQQRQRPRPRPEPLNKIDYCRICFFGVFLIVLLVNLYHVLCYTIISNLFKNNGKGQNQSLLNHLEFLTGPTMPIFNQYFYEQYLYELAKAQKWDKVIEVANQALQFPRNNEKFNIHYHKSLGLCFLQRFLECKTSIEKAYIYANRDKMVYIRKIYMILLSNDIVKSSEIPTGAEFAVSPTQQVPKLKPQPKRIEQKWEQNIRLENL